MISFYCPACDTELEVPDRAAGTKVNCPDCGKRFLVPSRSQKGTADRNREDRSSTSRSGKRKGKASEAGGISPGLIVACVSGGLALCVAFAVGAYFLLAGKTKEPPQPVAIQQPLPPMESPYQAPSVQSVTRPPASPPEAPSLPATAMGPVSGKDIYQHVLKSSAWIVIPHEASKTISMGTGTLIDKTNMLVLTNHHVVYSSPNVIVFFPSFNNGQLISERDSYLKRAERRDYVRGQVIAMDERRDLALVQLEKVPEGVEALAVAQHSADIGQNVHSVGNPGVSGALWVYTSGTVRQVYEKSWQSQSHAPPSASPPAGGQRPGSGSMMGGRPGTPGRGGAQQPGGQDPAGGSPEAGIIKHQHHARVVETQSPTNPGDSGGPLVNEQGELVGVTHGGASSAQLMSLFIDVSEATAFLQEQSKRLGMTWVRESRSLRLGSDPNQITALIKALENSDDNIRARAVQALGNAGVDAKMSIPEILRVVREDSKDVTRNMAIEALNKIGPPDRSQIGLLRDCLKDSNPKVRGYGAMAAGKLGRDAASLLQPLTQVARDGDVEVRQQATRALGKMGTDAKATVFPILTESLKDSDRDVRVAAAQALTGMDSLSATEVPVLTELLKHQDSEARVCAARALGRLGDKAKPAVPVLIEAFKQDDPALRAASIEALVKFANKDAAPAFTQALSDSDKETRKNACMGIAKIGPDAKAAVAELTKLLDDPEKDVKKQAVIALGKIGPAAKDAAVALGEMLMKETTLRVELLTALGEMGPGAKSAVSNIVLVFTFVNSTGRADRSLHMRAAQTLGKIGKDAVQELMVALDNDSNLIRVGAAMALGEIGPTAKKAAKNLAAHARGDLDPQVREVAGLAYSKVTAK